MYLTFLKGVCETGSNIEYDGIFVNFQDRYMIRFENLSELKDAIFQLQDIVMFIEQE